jgi:hypothetical protein
VTWFDDEKLEGHIVKEMAAGINSSVTCVCFITKRYIDKVNGDDNTDNCQLEFQYGPCKASQAGVHGRGPHGGALS